VSSGQQKISASCIELKLPATSANLGPAFDAAALALDLYLHVRAEVAEQFSIQAQGRDAHVCDHLDNNLIINTYCEVLRSQEREAAPLRLLINNEMPIGKGCGSSAAARLAGIALAVHFGRSSWSDSQIIVEASRREGHPDNASACWLGGLVIAQLAAHTDPSAGILTAAMNVNVPWPLLLAVPEANLSTEQARRVLPPEYSRADVVASVQSAMLLLAAFVQGRGDLLAAALNDRIHEPYRAGLCPLLPALKEMTGTEGIVGVALSGAGPSVLLFLDPKVAPERTRARVTSHLKNKALSAELLATGVATHGGCESLHHGTAGRKLIPTSAVSI
jgi:homoserine kinase